MCVVRVPSRRCVLLSEICRLHYVLWSCRFHVLVSFLCVNVPFCFVMLSRSCLVLVTWCCLVLCDVVWCLLMLLSRLLIMTCFRNLQELALQELAGSYESLEFAWIGWLEVWNKFGKTERLVDDRIWQSKLFINTHSMISLSFLSAPRGRNSKDSLRLNRPKIFK